MKKLICDMDFVRINAQALDPSDTIYQIAISANTANPLIIPADASIAVFSSTGDFYVRYDGEAATIPIAISWLLSDVELNPGVRIVIPDGTISVIAPAATVITVAFYC